MSEWIGYDDGFYNLENGSIIFNFGEGIPEDYLERHDKLSKIDIWDGRIMKVNKVMFFVDFILLILLIISRVIK